jgi:serine protease
MTTIIRNSIWSLLFGCILTTTAFAQPMTGRMLIRISPNAIAPVREAFSSIVSDDKHFDPQSCFLKDEAAIHSLFGIPESVKLFQLRPFVAQHNIALEALREKTNPILFANVKFATRIAETEGLHFLRTSEEKLSRWFEIIYIGLTPDQMMAILKKSSLIEVAEPRYSYPLCLKPTDPMIGDQYSLTEMNVFRGWDIQTGDSSMLVADDDIGVDWAHEDLRSSIYINPGETGLDANGLPKNANGIDDDTNGFVDDWHGWDFAGDNGNAPDNNPTATQDHGTHTSGIMAATANNKKGIAGVCFGARLLPIKCSDAIGSGVSFGYEGMVYAADMGASIVNNSWGGTNFSDVGQDIVNYVTGKNCLVVAAAGNSGHEEDLYPASFKHVLSVGATSPGHQFASDFSSYSIYVDVCAPGSNVLSTVPNNGYRNLTGTSMASPNASGVAALVRKQFPSLLPDQVIERLRVTCDPILNNPQPGETGGGIINAVTALDTSKELHSVRIVDVKIDDENHDGMLTAGESAFVTLYVKNYLDPVINLSGEVQIPNTSGVSSLNTSLQFGDVNTLDTTENSFETFKISIASNNTTSNRIIRLPVHFSSKASNYFDSDYFSFTINPSYLDLNKNNVTATIDSKSGIGYNDAPRNSQGSGFVWTKAPSQIVPEGKNIVFMAGLMIATSPEHMATLSPSPGSDSYADQDFTATSPVHYVLTPDHAKAIQEIESSYNDAKDPVTDSFGHANEVGVSIRQRSYEFGEGGAADAIVLDYLISHRDSDSSIKASDLTVASLFMDWDIGPNGVLNLAYVSPLDTAIAVTRRLDPNFPFVGIKLISDLPYIGKPGEETTAINFYALDNDGSNGSASTYSGFDNEEKWLTMITPRPLAGPRDVSMIYGVKDLPLATKGSANLTFVIAFGTDDASLKSAIDKTEALWKGTASVHSAPSTTSLLMYPNPTNDVVHLNWSATGKASISVVDILGRKLLTKEVIGTSTTLDLSVVPDGSYRIILETSDGTYSKSIIKQ